MPLLARLREANWPLLLTELFLIFVGITAALWFDGMKEARTERARERQILTTLVAALESDTADLNFNLRSTEVGLASIDRLLSHLGQRLPYDSSLAGDFSRASRFNKFFNNVAPYEHLKSVGVGTIRDDSLRLEIIDYYEVEVKYLVAIEDVLVQGNWARLVQPQMTQKFDYAFYFAPAVPHDYDALLDDRDYRTMLRTTRGMLAWKNRQTAAVARKAEALLDRIRRELEPVADRR